MTESKELEQVGYVLKKRGWVVVLFTIIGLAIGYAVSNFAFKPTYTSTTSLLVNDRSKQAAGGQTDFNVINTYKDLIVSRDVLKPVVNNLDDSLSVSDVRKMITVTTNTGSQVFSINVKSKDGDQATEIANNVSQEFQSKLSKMMGINNVSTIDKAQSDNQVKNSKSLFNTLIFGVIMGGGSFLACWIFDSRDKKAKVNQKDRLSRLN